MQSFGLEITAGSQRKAIDAATAINTKYQSAGVKALPSGNGNIIEVRPTDPKGMIAMMEIEDSCIKVKNRAKRI